MTLGGFARPAGAPPLVLGHRGVRGPAPENTMAAFAMAAAARADGVELDVRLCGSGEVVVLHDPTLARVSTGGDPRAVADLSTADLSRVDLGGGERVPLLADVLAFVRARRMRVNVELKHDVPDKLAVVRATARAIRGVPHADRWVLVSSFDPTMLALFGVLLPGVARGHLFHAGQAALRSGWLAGPLGARAVHPERTLVSPARARAWKRRGLLVNVWTVNSPREARDLAACGVDAIITDSPGDVGEAVRAVSDAGAKA